MSSRSAVSSTSRRRARAGASCWSSSACGTSCCCADRRRGRRGARSRAAPASCRRTTCERVTRAKLDAARARGCAARGLPPAPILCADTTVALGRRILGKPRDAARCARACWRCCPAARTACITAVALQHGRSARLRAERLARALRRRSPRRAIDALRRQRRAVRQGRRLCDPERAPRPGSSSIERQLLRYHGFAPVRDGATAATGAASGSEASGERHENRPRCKTS